MKAIDESLFTHLAVVPTSLSDRDVRNLDIANYPSFVKEPNDPLGFEDCVGVPLYVIAAAALLG